MQCLFSTALVIAISQAFEVAPLLVNEEAAVDIDFAFAEHLTKHGLSYESVEEYEVRKARFAEVDAIIRAHNSREGVSFTMGHNRFSDWSLEEIGFNAAAAPTEVEEKPLGDESGSVKVFDADNLATSLDWRSSGNVSTVIYDQFDKGPCYNSWAFAAAGTVGSAYSAAGGDLYELSVQQLMDCNLYSTMVEGCSGGDAFGAYQYYQSEKTIVQNSDYPWTGDSEDCMVSGKPVSPVQVTLWNLITTLDASQIKAALAQSPVSAVVNGDCYGFVHYSGGIFDGTNGFLDCPDNLTFGLGYHNVQLVGYGTDSTSGQEFFILKNSMGESWGESGYMRILNSPTDAGIIGLNLKPQIPQTNNLGAGSDAVITVPGVTQLAVAILALALTLTF